MKSKGCWTIKTFLWVLTVVTPVVVELAWADSNRGTLAGQSYRQPSAVAGQDYVAIVGDPVEFLGYGASPDDEIIEYTWDFDNDGVPDFVSAQQGYTTHRFITPGHYQCVMTVKDSLGRVSRDIRRIIVVAEQSDLAAARQMLQAVSPALGNPPDGGKHRYAGMIK